MLEMTHPRPRSLARALCEGGVVFVFLLLVLLPWEAWLGAKPTLARMSEGASWAHPLGFDNLGRDLLARIASALRGAVLPLWAAVAVGAGAGAFVAWLATLAPARRAVTALDGAMALACGLPVGVVAFAWAAFREEAGLVAVMASLAPLAGALAYLRLRDLARRDAALAYWEAHRAAGGSLADRVLRYGIAGAWRTPLLTLLGFLLRVAVAVEAALSYLGFGVVEPQASFGNILAAHFELYLRGEWRVLAVVAAALALAAAFPSALLEVGAALARSRMVAWAAAPRPLPSPRPSPSPSPNH
jgi:peptide/nickel transport system permease protein